MVCVFVYHWNAVHYVALLVLSCSASSHPTDMPSAPTAIIAHIAAPSAAPSAAPILVLPPLLVGHRGELVPVGTEEGAGALACRAAYVCWEGKPRVHLRPDARPEIHR